MKMKVFYQKVRRRILGLPWVIYPKIIRLYSICAGRKLNEDYKKKGFIEGQLSKSQLDGLLSAIRKAKIKPISYDDFDPDFIIHTGLKAYEKDLNSSHKLYVLEEEQINAIKPILETLKEPIAECLGTPWKIVNLLCWETHPQAIETGPNEWHKDGMPFAVQKIMIYLTGANIEIGTTALKLADDNTHYVSGPPGTWLLFKISEILHKGMKPKTGTRIVFEIRAIPSFEFDLRPHSAGFNAHYPKVPWWKSSQSSAVGKNT